MEQLAEVSLPLIILVKTDSVSNKIVHELASFLKCPLIDENDITKALAKTTTKSSLSDEIIRNLPFEVVCEIASTQLSLNIGVIIINVALSDPTQLNKLEQLASPSKARLIIIDFESKVKTEYRKIPRLRIDPESFDVKKIISNMFILLSDEENIEVTKKEKENKLKIKPPVNDHLHELSLSDNPRKDKLRCQICPKALIGSCYQCVECDEFTLHKVCAESALDFKNCPSFLTIRDPIQYSFPHVYKCNNCIDFSYDCYDCLFQTHLKHKFLATILHCEARHPHPLNLIIMPFRYNYQYQCCICDKLGNSISYKCFDCNYDIHVNCILKSTINVFGYDFILTSNTFQNHDYRCYFCKKEIDWGQLFYLSEEICNAHLNCFISPRNFQRITAELRVITGN